MITRNIIKQNAYYDSVTLMVISSKLTALEGVQNAAVMMGTDHNKELMKNSGLLLEENTTATPNDMIIGIIAEEDSVVEEALKVIEEQLENKKSSTSSDDVRVKTLDSAKKNSPDANFAVISVPGKYAKNEAMKALEAGLNVLLFSDNVTIEEENELKDKAVKEGLLMMGPDCGTAIINGTALGFANAVNPGNIGMVAAAGTGLQEATCIVDSLGSGVSQALGTGGRDLKEAIGGKMMLLGLEALANDEATKVIVLISKPPSPIVMEKILETVKTINKPVVTCFLGGDPALVKGTGAIGAETLEDAATAAVRIMEGKEPESVFFTIDNAKIEEIVKEEIQKLGENQKYVRGLYSGGTLCYEGMLVTRETIGNVYSNVALKENLLLKNVEESFEHTFLDMGEDYFTDGLPHPMIDTRLRVERIKKEALDPEVAVLLLDVVLGYGCHEDPAGAIAPAIVEAKERAAAEGRYLSVVATVCGTDKDPQNRQEQEEKLRSAGAVVMPSNAQAARMASLIATRDTSLEKLLEEETACKM
ncbi:acyl-CoA synthetase FdrA [Natronincola ferrireducens]|uniref:Succinyl-CoA synthetase, alpha subunit n=1 Tax=Natronincola ferrireducens TaxID=393762 RepID=A0A1G9G0D5_9FIRM|nr:acyl-CoA synthetase FdrA [Natronincola ferrireducens]SDK94104.1 Succinyl-CoA synthetase, alpha subunit [Natronincola ferrireducens]